MISCNFVPVEGGYDCPQCHCPYLCAPGEPPPVRDCAASPAIKVIAESLGMQEGVLSPGIMAEIFRWIGAGRPERSSGEQARLSATCQKGDSVAMCARLLRFATWRCPRETSVPKPMSEESILQAMRDSIAADVAAGVATISKDEVERRLEDCYQCPTLTSDGCARPCICSQRWAQWKKRILLGDCEGFGKA